jgi:Helicase conserved C-terminal domain
MDVIDREKDRGPKCPVCRRAITEDSLIEVCTDASSGFDENDVNGTEETQVEVEVEGQSGGDVNGEQSSIVTAESGVLQGDRSGAKQVVSLDVTDHMELAADYQSILSKRKRKKSTKYLDDDGGDEQHSSSSSSSSSSGKGSGRDAGMKKKQMVRNDSVSSVSVNDDNTSNNTENSIKMDTTEFIFSDLNLHSSAVTNSDLASIPPPHRLILRNPEYPSLDATFLSHLGAILRDDFISSRMIAVLSDIIEVRKTEPAAKFLIFSQYSDSLKESMAMLNSMNTTHENVLEGNLFECVIVDGKDSPEAREKSLKRFMEEEKCNICFLTLNAAAAGLTLTVAHVCYLLEPTHSAADEAQVRVVFLSALLFSPPFLPFIPFFFTPLFSPYSLPIPFLQFASSHFILTSVHPFLSL